MKNPVIVFKGCVLIGQRRAEIARQFGWETIPVAEITTDITADPDPGRVLDLKESLYSPASY